MAAIFDTYMSNIFCDSGTKEHKTLLFKFKKIKQKLLWQKMNS